MTFRVERLTGQHDLAGFDCGEPSYNEWLTRHATAAVRAGVCAVYVLVEAEPGGGRVMGYYAISPTEVVRSEVPGVMARGWPVRVPAWRLGKLAVHVELRGDTAAAWGRQVLRHALKTLVRIADSGGGKVIVVDADNPGLIGFYTSNGFRSTGLEGDLTLYMKVSTARKALAD